MALIKFRILLNFNKWTICPNILASITRSNAQVGHLFLKNNVSYIVLQQLNSLGNSFLVGGNCISVTEEAIRDNMSNCSLNYIKVSIILNINKYRKVFRIGLKLRNTIKIEK